MENIDQRDPQLRIEKLLDSNTFSAITEKNTSGMLAAHGKIKGVAVTVFCTEIGRAHV